MFGFADPSLRIKSAAIWQLHISILETQEKQENGFFHSYRLPTKRTKTADKWTLLFGRCHFISLILCQQRQKRRSAFCWKWAGNIQSIKVLNNPALTEGSMSRALVHKCAQTSIDKFYYYVTSNARFYKKRRCYQSVICKLWSEGAIAREYRQIVDLDSTDTGAYLLKHCLLAECLWGLSHVCSWWKLSKFCKKKKQLERRG